MRPFFCVIKVILSNPISAAAGDASEVGRLIGYYRRIGGAAESQADAECRIATAVPDGQVDWTESAFMPFEEIEDEIAAKYESSSEIFWYKSGRAFFQG